MVSTARSENNIGQSLALIRHPRARSVVRSVEPESRTCANRGIDGKLRFRTKPVRLRISRIAVYAEAVDRPSSSSWINATYRVCIPRAASRRRLSRSRVPRIAHDTRVTCNIVWPRRGGGGGRGQTLGISVFPGDTS